MEIISGKVIIESDSGKLLIKTNFNFGKFPKKVFILIQMKYFWRDVYGQMAFKYWSTGSRSPI